MLSRLRMLAVAAAVAASAPAAAMADAAPRPPGVQGKPPSPRHLTKARSDGKLKQSPRRSRRAKAHLAAVPGHTHSRLWCSGNQIGGDASLSALTQGNSVIVSSQLFRWTNAGWVADVRWLARTAWDPIQVTVRSRWTDTSGQLGTPTPTFTIGLHGYYYAIAQKIIWVTRAGQYAGEDYRWLTDLNGNYYCRM